MNDLKLQESFPLDENLRPIKIDDKVTPLELSNDTVRVKNLEIMGTVLGEFTDPTKLPLAGGTMTGNIACADGFILDCAGDLNLDAAGGDINFKEDGDTTMIFDIGSGPMMKIYESPGGTDYFYISTFANGVALLGTVDAAGSDGYMTIQPDGNLNLNPATGIINFTDNSDTDDAFKITVVGGTGATTLETISDAADGHLSIVADGHVEFDGCGVGFDLVTPTYNASDTDVDFTTGNKQFVNFGSGNITDLNLIFPKTSGNFVLMLKQDGTGSRTVTNYKVWDIVNSDAASGSATVKFAGGSNPTLTTDANHVDIISFFYDADNEIAYGVASLDFQF
jgi:hypothetical protein